MPKWSEYVKKNQPSDKDLMMIEDVAANANKRLEFSGLADWIIEKLKKNNVISGALKFKGSSAYASLPTNPEQNDYYYSPDGNGTDGAGYYAWNGTTWIFIGNNDKGIDSTFTVEGAAADSKAVGDKFAKVDSETASLKEDLTDKNNRLTGLDGIIYPAWEIGYCEANGASGWLYADQNYRIRTPKELYINLKVGDIIKSSDDTIVYHLMRYNDGAPKSVTQYQSAKFTVTAEDKYKICAMVSGSLSEITDISTVSSAISIVRTGQIDTINSEIDTINIVPIWECGTLDGGKNKYDSLNLRSQDILHIKAGSTISKVSENTDFAIYVSYFARNDINTFIGGSQIIPLKRTSYTFPNDCYVRLLLQYVGSSAINPTYAYENVVCNLISCHDYSSAGVNIRVMKARTQIETKNNKTVYGDIVGSGVLMKFANGKTFMIDCFGKNGYWTGEGVYTDIRTEIRNYGVRHVDYFMLSHWHGDHCGNIENLINDGFIDSSTTVVLPTDLDETQTEGLPSDWSDVVANMNAYKPLLVSAGCNIVYPTEGQTIEIADCLIKFWNCDHTVFYNSGAYHSTNYNDWSICAYLFCGNTNFCYTADLGPIGQQKMVDLGTMVKANLYTSTHHGWDNGVASNYYGLIPAWINRLSPDAVFSQDYQIHQNMMYDDSHKKQFPMQSWCEANSVGHYRTYITGGIEINMNQYGWKFLGGYSKYIRDANNKLSGKNWSWSDNSEHIEF